MISLPPPCSIEDVVFHIKGFFYGKNIVTGSVQNELLYKFSLSDNSVNQWQSDKIIGSNLRN